MLPQTMEFITDMGTIFQSCMKDEISVDAVSYTHLDVYKRQAKRLEGRSPETHNHYRSAIKFLYKKVLKILWDDDTVPAMLVIVMLMEQP